MELVTRRESDQTVVAVHGALDLETASVLRSALTVLRQAGARKVVVDLREATSLDASAATGLMLSAGRFRAVGAVLAIRSPSRDVRQVIGITGLDIVVRIDD